MIDVTIAARVILRRTLERYQRDVTDVLRIAREAGGFKAFVGREVDGDELIDHDGRTILAIDAELSSELDGAIIDSDSERLIFRPAVKA